MRWRLAWRAAESMHKVLAFKKRFANLLRPTRAPSPVAVEKLTRKLWEFSEQVRLEGLA